MPADDLPLPDHEPAVLSADSGPAVSQGTGQDADDFGGLDDFAPFDDAGTDSPDAPLADGGADASFSNADSGSDFMDFGDLGDLLGSSGPDLNPDDAEPDLGEFDLGENAAPDPAADAMGDFLDTLPNDPGAVEEPLDDISEDAAPPDELPADDDFSMPEDLLNGLADDIESERASADTGDLGDFGSDLDLESLPDFGSDEITASDENTSDIEIPDLDEDLGSFEDAEPVDDVPAAAGADEESMDLSFDEGDGGFDLGGESLDLDTSSMGGDTFDNFNLDSDALKADFNIGSDIASGDAAASSGFGDDFGNLEDFSLPGIDNVFNGRTPGAAPGQAAPAGTKGAVVDEADLLGEVEEISLTDEDFGKLQDTLASYPLNLRIACEELIAEEAVSPDLMSNLIKLLVRGAPAKETAALAGKILGRTIPIPKGFEKKTGEELEAEQASFAYIFVHNFLPVLRLFMGIALVAVSLGYLIWNFIYLPQKAESIYKKGYERIAAGEYGRANDRFNEAFGIHQKKDWFYKYAEAFRDERQYIYAEEKYDQLLYYTASKNKRHIPEKKAVLDYANLETNYLRNYAKADSLLWRNILDYIPYDRDALLALGDNNLAWGEIEPARYEDAREAYAKLLENYGRTDPVLERMLKYFIRTDNLGEVLPLQNYFMYSEKRRITAPTLAELGGYLLDKRTEEVRGVPNEYRDSIGGIRDVLLRAVRSDTMLPESYYHLSRYYEYYGNSNDERLTLERANAAFDAAREETPRRLAYRIDALRRYAGILINRREFFPAEEQLVKGVHLYEDGLSRRILKSSPAYGKLYADLGDLEYFVKDGDMRTAIGYYRDSERTGYAPPEILYRMGAAHYQLRQWPDALNRFFAASSEMPLNRRILYALGNVSYLRGNYHAAQGYYDRLLEILDADRSRFPLIMPTDNEEQLELAERLMVAQNNMGVTLEALTERTGSNSYRSRAQGLYSDSERAWDVMTRNPLSMVRMRPSPEITAPGVNPAYLNVQNSLHPVPDYEPQFFLRIDKDVLEPSPWEGLAPPAFHLSEGLSSGR
ncbi:tetratricopeptide repeat domain protein [Leadbettera azotonutricia ZAS-9]|uniref:Tetratricopeptide repeat domain protein n=2 Tax=Leadbettera azotonutricia TaxID=150829 RepID=F5Y812_LEAAZ|nr:tetratricopeptide repeat domain protein [Leadbettera azotonutricia ZAS-9]